MKTNVFRKIFASVALASVCITTTLGAVTVSATEFYAPTEPTYGNFFISIKRFLKKFLKNFIKLNKSVL